MSDQETSTFGDLADFMALPRLAGLALSPDGSRLVTTVATLDPTGKKWRTALWEVDPSGERAARRLTRGSAGESAPSFAPDGSVLFLSKRDDPDAEAADDAKPSLWSLPADGGEARVVAKRSAGIGSFAVATDSGDVAVVTSVAASAELTTDSDHRDARKKAGVSAILHESYPVRFWDHDLGSSIARAYWLGQLDGDTPPDEAEWRDLAPHVEMPHGVGEAVVLSASGALVARVDRVPTGNAGWRTRIVVADTATGDESVVLDDVDTNYGAPQFSPDGSTLVAIRQSASTWAEPPDSTLVTTDLTSGSVTEITAGFDRWPTNPKFSADGSAVYFTADDDGRHPVFRVAAGESPVRLTADGYYSDLQIAADGSALYALRSAHDSPGSPVRLDPVEPMQSPVSLPHPGEPGELPGTLTEIDAVGQDGTRVQSWLVLPHGASAATPAPLVLWIHGGPLMSWNAWSWRWNPWLLVARGYAVLMPNPGLSQGFGQDMVRRGWGAWGAEPFTDLMAAVDVAIARADIDETRTAAMGGSFGGYMANWVATQTDRFKAVVTHASLWHLDGFVGATDSSYYWEQEFGDALRDSSRYDANSPHRFADNIVTPMLVIHGDKDYRVPIGEGLRLWYDLQKRDVPSKFLYFPDENHWILTPGNATVWYETVLAFLGDHVLGDDWVRPELV